MSAAGEELDRPVLNDVRALLADPEATDGT
jgi:hypothetical protein